LFSNMQLLRRQERAAARELKEPTIPWQCYPSDSEGSQLSADRVQADQEEGPESENSDEQLS
jgi:hypothetical protein